MLMFWLASMTHPTSETNRVEEMNSKPNNVGVELLSDFQPYLSEKKHHPVEQYRAEYILGLA